jgi:aryl-alcohol dehydrogenase-like predicted oxidoreductase
MKKLEIGRSGINASTLVLGTWVIGGDSWGGTDESDSLEAIAAVLDSGINFIDTAPIYGCGVSEEVVGKAIAGKRDQVVLATKVGLRWDCEDGDFSFEGDDGTRVFKNLSADSITYEVEASLKRLKTDFIDLLQTHWPDSTTEVDETMGALLKLKESGKIRAIGACNLTPALFEAYQAAGGIDSMQEMYSMVDRGLEADLFPMAHAAGASVLAYSPMAMGLLTGKVGPDRTFGKDDLRSWSPRFTVENRQKVAGLLEKFSPYTEKYGVTTAQLVLAWTLAQLPITHVLCGIRNRAQAEENLRGGELVLESEDVAAMNAILDAEAIKLPHPYGGE